MIPGKLNSSSELKQVTTPLFSSTDQKKNKKKSNGTEFVASLKVWQNAYIENSEAKWLNDYSQLQPNLPSSRKCRIIFLEEYNEKRSMLFCTNFTK